MRRIKQAKPSAALIVAVVALVAALGGGAVAGVAVTSLNKKDKKQVTKIAKKQGKKQAKKQIGKQFPVESSQLADGAVTNPKLANSAVDGAKIANNSIGDSKLSDLDVFGDPYVRATPTVRTTLSEAQDAAPKVPLFSKGQLSIYGKCVTAEETPETFARVYAETSAAGSIFTGDEVEKLEGDPDYLDPGTPESDRVVGSASAGAGSLRAADLSRTPFIAMSPNGAAVQGLASMAVKLSTPSNGLYGPGVVCLFSGYGIG